MENLTEKEIIEKIKNGQINYFEFFVKKYSRILLPFVRSRIQNTMDADDIVQNAFIKAYKALDRFDINKKFYPYLFSIIKNEIADFYRKNKVLLRLDEKIDIPVSLPNDNKLDFEGLLKRLKPDYQKVLKLQLEGFSYQEISKKINKPINTIKTILRRAKLIIKNYERVK